MLAAKFICLSLCLAGPAAAAESPLRNIALRFYGFIQTDIIADTTAGFNEEQGNSLVPPRAAAPGAPNSAGRHHRTQTSVRNSRVGLDLGLPKADGSDVRAVFEFDLMGNNAPNTQPGSSPKEQSERDFFNNPAVRLRHAFVSATRGAWNAKLGQTWSLLGWQPHYFPAEAIVQPGPGQLYRRFAQARITLTQVIKETWELETAADLAKPAQMDSGSPEFHAGARLASTRVKGASISGASASMEALSAAVSCAFIPVRTASLGSPTGEAVAFDIFFPVIPSR
ncbi:MAG: hypothetical protein PHF00_14030, partial [Elusimicrobia bacterium]|nr:hypothetical protein [Elusimicrobiota bacterium]